jgi:hypothetical protein
MRSSLVQIIDIYGCILEPKIFSFFFISYLVMTLTWVGDLSDAYTEAFTSICAYYQNKNIENMKIFFSWYVATDMNDFRAVLYLWSFSCIGIQNQLNNILKIFKNKIFCPRCQIIEIYGCILEPKIFSFFFISYLVMTLPWVGDLSDAYTEAAT